MTDLRGMTIREFNDTLAEMKTIYDFDPDKTKLGDTRDPRANEHRRVEIYTTDEKTGIDIMLAKHVGREEMI